MSEDNAFEPNDEMLNHLDSVKVKVCHMCQ